MKREFLKELGLADDVIDKIMTENGKDIESEKAKVTAKESELNTANQTIKNLQEAVKKFDGVDLEKLKNDVKDWETKYNTDIAATKLHSAIDLALVGAKAKNPKLAKAALDIENIKLDNDKLLGFDEQITKLKESDAYLFEETQQTQTTKTKVNTALDHKDPLGDGATTLLGALQERFK